MSYLTSITQPPVSVALATYNGARYLREQLDSILAQDLPPAEIVVSDGGSTDATMAILEEYAASGAIRIAEPAGRMNVRDNFQHAVRHCGSANLIAFSDQDDVWMPQKLSHSVAALGELATGTIPALVFSDLEVVSETLEPVAPSFWKVLDIDPRHERFSSLLFGNIVTGCTILMNPAMRFRFAEMPKDGPSMHDAWLGLVAYSFGRAVPLSEPLVRYRQHLSSVTNETNQRRRPLERLVGVIRNVLQDSGFLDAELRMAKAFRECFGDMLDREDGDTLNHFLALESAGFLRRKRAAIISRRYRYTRKF